MSRWAGSMVPTACVEAASEALSASVSGPSTSGPPDVSPVLITGSAAGCRGEGGAGDGGMRWRRAAGREGGNGVTLTEPAVDKTLRQIRQSIVWSLFCFPLLLLSGGFYPLFFSDIPSLFLRQFILTNLISPPPLLPYLFSVSVS